MRISRKFDKEQITIQILAVEADKQLGIVESSYQMEINTLKVPHFFWHIGYFL